MKYLLLVVQSQSKKCNNTPTFLIRLDENDSKINKMIFFFFQIYMTTTSINQFTSSLLLTVMSADRYIAVCHPISSPRYRTPFIAKFVCLTAWTVSALLMVPVYLYATAFDIPKETIGECNNW